MQVAATLAASAPAPLDAHGARDMLRLSLLDWAALGLAGQAEPVATILRDRAIDTGGRAETSVIGTTVRLPMQAAALVNGATAHAPDYDDSHFAHTVHPSVAVIPAALGMGELRGADLGAAIDAAQIGAEITTHPQGLTVCNQPESRTGLEARFSCRLTAATMLAGRQTGALDTFSDAACTDPALVALRDRITVTGDAALTETQARVRLWRDTTSVDLVHDLDAPLSLPARTARLNAKARALLGPALTDRLANAIATDDLPALTALLRGSP